MSSAKDMPERSSPQGKPRTVAPAQQRAIAPALQRLQAEDMDQSREASADAAGPAAPASAHAPHRRSVRVPSQQHRAAYPERSSRELSSMQRALAHQQEQAARRQQERGGGLFGERQPERPVARQPVAVSQHTASPFDAYTVQRPWLDDVLEPLGPFVPRSQSALTITVIGIASLVVILMYIVISGGSSQIASWGGPLQQAVNSVTGIFHTPTPNPPGNYHLRGAPSLTAAQADEILAAYGSPAQGTGRAWVEIGERYNIDPAFALAFFIHESSAGTNPNWAGFKADGSTTHNVGNIICAGYATCYGRFRDYDSWETGIADWYRLIDDEYIKGRGTQTVADIIPIYAPAFENDVNGYVRAVEQLVDGWRLQYGVYEPASLNVPASAQPRGNPLNAINTVMTQDYGIGTHAPANVWGAIDLALDGNGDGTADPEGTQGRPIYATHDGVVKVSANSYPAGNHVWVINEHYKTGYAHLQSFAVSAGQTVRRGDVIGYIGSTGQSSGPHLDYQVWEWRGGAWVNVNPQEYHVFERMQ
jgi:murein DD-endopeptidase MepM/ murein hydrolase activator NlpD